MSICITNHFRIFPLAEEQRDEVWDSLPATDCTRLPELQGLNYYQALLSKEVHYQL